MRKLFSMMLVAAALAVAIPVSAQSVKFGVKGGYNITDLQIDKTSTFNSVKDMAIENKNGWYVGPTLKVKLIGALGFDIAAFYDQRESTIEEEKIKEKYVYVPLNLRLNIGLGSLAGLYIAAGPQVGFNIGDTEISMKNLDGTAASFNDNFQLKKSTFGINVGAGVYLFKHLEVGAVYNIPLGNTADIEGSVLSAASDLEKKYDVKNNTFQVSAAIYF